MHISSSIVRKLSGDIARVTLAAAALMIFLAVPNLFAQTDTGGIAGTVTDATGAVIPNVTITATSTDTGRQLTATTNGTGNFTILAVPRGNYNVAASATGFQGDSAVVTVNIQDTQTVAFQLQPAGATTTVTVTAAAPLIDTSNSTIGAAIQGRQVTELPLNGRNFSSLALLTPGVTRGAYGDVASGGGTSNNTETIRTTRAAPQPLP